VRSRAPLARGGPALGRLPPFERLLSPRSRLSPRRSVTGSRRPLSVPGPRDPRHTLHLALDRHHRLRFVTLRQRCARITSASTQARRENDTTANRGFTGQGPCGFRRRHLSLPGSSFRCRQGPRSPLCTLGCRHPKAHVNARELRPNPIRSGTSCRGLAAPPDGDSDGAPATPPRGPSCAVTRRSSCEPRDIHASCKQRARGLPEPRAASSALPRRRSDSAAPKVPSIDEPASIWRLRRSVTPVSSPSPFPSSFPKPLRSVLTERILHRGPKLSTACHQGVENACAFDTPGPWRSRAFARSRLSAPVLACACAHHAIRYP